MTPENRAAYWSATLRLRVTLLVIGFLVSFGCGILLAEPLNEFHLGGFKLGFWFAQQGCDVRLCALGDPLCPAHESDRRAIRRPRGMM